jgi:predicted nucleic acid-binding protein
MNKLVVNSNIVFSALLNIDSRIGQVLISGKRFYTFFATEYVRNEVIQHKEIIKRLAELNENEFLELYGLVMHSLTIIHHEIVPYNIYRNAENLCKDVDIDDTVFIAVATFKKRGFGRVTKRSLMA